MTVQNIYFQSKTLWTKNPSPIGILTCTHRDQVPLIFVEVLYFLKTEVKKYTEKTCRRFKLL